MIDYDIETELKPCLGQDEELIWTGKPKTGIVFRSTDFFLIPFSFCWSGFAFFMIKQTLVSSLPFLVFTHGVPFGLAGLYMLVGRFFIDAKKRKNTCYGITKDRIIIKSGVISIKFLSLYIKNISYITFSHKQENSGTITLGSKDYKYSTIQGIEQPVVKQTPCIEFIQDAKNVYDLIINLQRQY